MGRKAPPDPWVSTARPGRHVFTESGFGPRSGESRPYYQFEMGLGSVGSCRAIRCSMSPSEQAAIAVAAVCGSRAPRRAKATTTRFSIDARPRDSASRSAALWLASRNSTKARCGHGSVRRGQVLEHAAQRGDQLIQPNGAFVDDPYPPGATIR